MLLYLRYFLKAQFVRGYNREACEKLSVEKGSEDYLFDYHDTKSLKSWINHKQKIKVFRVLLFIIYGP